MKYLNVMAVIIVMFMAANLPADIDTFWASDDAYVDSVNTDSTFNSETLQIQGFSGSGIPGDVVVESVQRSFLKFDVTGLENKTILSAKFRVYLNPNGWFNLSPPSMQLTYVEDDSWLETSLNWDNQPSGTTPIGASLAIGGAGYQEWRLYQKDAPSFDDWYDDHLEGDGFASYMLTVGNPDMTSYAYFSSDEGANRPELIIEYIPEPATLILLGLGTMLIRKRRGRSSL